MAGGDGGRGKGVTSGPFSGGVVGSEEEGRGGDDQKDGDGDDGEGGPPRVVSGHTAVDEALEDGDLDDEGDTAFKKWMSATTNRGGRREHAHPPPRLPQPPTKELAVPTMLLSKKVVVQARQGTKVAPRIPMKKRMMYTRKEITVSVIVGRGGGGRTHSR